MRKLCLIIVDGFGVAEPGPGNARTLAKLPLFDRMEKKVPHCLMEASGNAVGLPKGQQGASEPGHLTMGAGRVVWQPLEQINHAIETGDFFKNKVLVAACERAASNGKPLHLVGLYSSGGVHSALEHFHAMIQLAKLKGVAKVFLHLIGDGRDVGEQQFSTDFDLLKEEVTKQQLGTIASLVGRFFAMDRDKQYADRTKVAYDLLVEGKGEVVEDVAEGARKWYVQAPDKENTDYYIRPLKTKEFQPIHAEDVVVCVNFRSDRMIQIVRALEAEDFNEFPRPVRVSDVTCMGPYSPHLPVAFIPQEVKNGLGEVISGAGLKQLRVAETDKFAHVTFFFNAQRQEPWPGEERILIESPKVPNYADAPQMSAAQVAQTVIDKCATGEFPFIMVNFANPDLVGHGGKIDAAVTACETVDRELGRVLPALEAAGYDWIVTSDHGNAECMLMDDGSTISPSHTANPVETFVHSPAISADDLAACTGLKDIAPLCLKIMGLPVPAEMR
jgi:2,3-bisphosphoglycerate-independent phosphoglycerate mutase